MGFSSGVLFHAAVKSLGQDMHGKEKYIEMIRIAWTDAAYTVPMAIGLMALSFVGMWGVSYYKVVDGDE